MDENAPVDQENVPIPKIRKPLAAILPVCKEEAVPEEEEEKEPMEDNFKENVPPSTYVQESVKSCSGQSGQSGSVYWRRRRADASLLRPVERRFHYAVRHGFRRQPPHQEHSADEPPTAAGIRRRGYFQSAQRADSASL